MNFDKVPGWVAWLAQDGNGASHPHGAGRGCEPLKRNSHALGLRSRANKQDCGWYEMRLDASFGWEKPRRRATARPR